LIIIDNENNPVPCENRNKIELVAFNQLSHNSLSGISKLKLRDSPILIYKNVWYSINSLTALR
jgi:hypothetical protein